MSEHSNPGGLLARYYSLPRGPRVCLRLVRPRDLWSIRELLERQDADLGELDVAGLVHFDVMRRLVVCATALVDSREQVVGVGALELEHAATGELSLLVVDDEVTDGLPPLLTDALIGLARAINDARAA